MFEGISPGYIRWYFSISHPYIVRKQKDAPIPMPPKQESIDELVVESMETTSG